MSELINEIKENIDTEWLSECNQSDVMGQKELK